MKTRSAVLVLTATLCTASCTDAVVRPPVPPISESVTGNAASALREDGKFALPDAPPGSINAQQAMIISRAYARTFGRMLSPSWEQDRHAPVDFERLSSCGRPMYARSAYDSLPSDANFIARQLYGGYWLTSLCGSDGVPEVSVAIPAGDTAIHVVNGRFSGPPSLQVISSGIPQNYRSLPVSPEDVAERVAQATGRRIAEVPQLVAAPFPQAPQLARWRVTLDSPVNLEGRLDHRRRVVSELYFGPATTWAQVGLVIGDSVAAPLIRDPSGKGRTVAGALARGYSNHFQLVEVVP